MTYDFDNLISIACFCHIRPKLHLFQEPRNLHINYNSLNRNEKKPLFSAYFVFLFCIRTPAQTNYAMQARTLSSRHFISVDLQSPVALTRSEFCCVFLRDVDEKVFSLFFPAFFSYLFRLLTKRLTKCQNYNLSIELCVTLWM